MEGMVGELQPHVKEIADKCLAVVKEKSGDIALCEAAIRGEKTSLSLIWSNMERGFLEYEETIDWTHRCTEANLDALAYMSQFGSNISHACACNPIQSIVYIKRKETQLSTLLEQEFKQSMIHITAEEQKDWVDDKIQQFEGIYTKLREIDRQNSDAIDFVADKYLHMFEKFKEHADRNKVREFYGGALQENYDLTDWVRRLIIVQMDRTGNVELLENEVKKILSTLEFLYRRSP